MTPRYVSVSEMEDFLKCPWRWYARWVLNRVPRKYSEALILGTAVHDIFEAHFKGVHDLDAAWHLANGRLMMPAADPDLAVARGYARRNLEKFKPQIVGFVDKFRIEETLEVEEPFEVKISKGWVFRGRPDRGIVVGGKVYHMQTKTAAMSKTPHVFAQYLSRSMHETLYGGYYRDRYTTRAPYGGSIINLIRKGAPKTPEDVHKFGMQLMVPISDYDIDRAQSRANVIILEMQKAQALADKAGHWALLDNPLQDAGVYGNSLDGYLPVLRHEAELDDDSLYMAREETYVPGVR